MNGQQAKHRATLAHISARLVLIDYPSKRRFWRL
jgi:hypothetical protein